MKNIYRHTQRGFEKLTYVATAILGNSITFLIALGTVIFWLSNKRFSTEDIDARIGDVILGLTFLYLFIIQKSFIHFSASLHLKINELVASNKAARNAVINAEERTEDEITELSKDYAELVEKTKEVAEKIGSANSPPVPHN
jgi:low affinity Fe/Cu permease